MRDGYLDPKGIDALLEQLRKSLGHEVAVLVTARMVQDENDSPAPVPPAATSDLRPQPAGSNLQRQAEMDRTRRINELMARAKTYWKQQQYEPALGQLAALLAIDPGNDEALTLRQVVQDMV